MIPKDTCWKDGCPPATLERTLSGQPDLTHVRWGIYLRISEDRLGTELGVQRQEEVCRRIVQAKGGDVVQLYVENDTSATKGRRPIYQQLLRDAEAGAITGVIVWAIDRLLRKPRELEDLIDLHDKSGVALATAQGDIDLGAPAGRLMARTLANAAAYEIEQKRERQRAANRQRAVMGRNHGGRRGFGYEHGGLDIRESEAEIVRALAARLLAGESLNSLTRWLIATGVPTVGGGVWTNTSVRRILGGPRIAGMSSYQGAVVGKAEWPPIIDEATWQRIRVLLDTPTRRMFWGNTRARVYPLRGLCFCGICTTELVGRNSNNGKRGYVCPSKPPWQGCGRIRIAAESFEDWLATKVIAQLAQPHNLIKIRQRLPRHDDDVDLAGQLAADEAQRLLIMGDYADRLIPRDAYLAGMARLEQRIEETRRRLARDVVDAEIPKLTPAGMVEWWNEHATVDQKRALIMTRVERVLIRPATRRGFTGMDADRVQVTYVE